MLKTSSFTVTQVYLRPMLIAILNLNLTLLNQFVFLFISRKVVGHG
jgi:hypothetical protein